MDEELVARLVASPSSYDYSEGQLLWPKLVQVYGAGLSFFRSGTSGDQIRKAIKRITEQTAEPQALVGAVLIKAKTIRNCGNPSKFFCVYDTDADEFDRHADLVGTWPSAPSNTKIRKEQESRQRLLRDKLGAKIICGSTAEILIDALLNAGFHVQ